MPTPITHTRIRPAERGGRKTFSLCVGLCGSEAGRSHLERDAGAMFSKLSSIGPWHTASVLRKAVHKKRSVHESSVDLVHTNHTSIYRISCITKTTGVPLLIPSSSTRAPLVVYLTPCPAARAGHMSEPCSCWSDAGDPSLASTERPWTE